MAWWPLGTVTISSGKLWVGDAQYAPSIEDGLVIDVPAGEYKVSVHEVFVRRGAKRMRAVLNGSKHELGPLIGETWADTGSHGVCDQVLVAQVEVRVGEGFTDLFMDAYEREKPGMFSFDGPNGPAMAWSFIEGGDGDFQVYELLDKGARCGIEVDFNPEEE